MRDPYRGVYGDYTPLTYSIESVIGPYTKSRIQKRAQGVVITEAAGKIKEGVNRIGQSFKAFAEALTPHPVISHSEWKHDEPSSDITKAGDLEANRV
ncbi:hypothetical protein SEA_RUNHAAR_51 [Gordonia phage Runhaar]|uniref:Uncharacterized protein n=1 Tax=Gordonia phage Crocheter TaxID=2656532 RepID=A0A649VDK1_9CAUD|nr:hypothetical protein HWC81_gp51 [Gordonia phage Crocheter]QGJ90396.1 hypothetical protein PBI_CROCHETER_51 [Gordonia phage Crocheter]QXO14655.1 hypothetical protein SEA_RUNHAAR_51 [Gordonia phage Runhaar]QZD97833.1 hypothetical protein SEA_NADMEG_52 [Gordonia phage Nadmeg]